MTSRRDWQLQQLGITQWSLRRPGALQAKSLSHWLGIFVW
nr:DNA polymerase III psi subunit [Raoultella sp. NCTC 9187]